LNEFLNLIDPVNLDYRLGFLGPAKTFISGIRFKNGGFGNHLTLKGFIEASRVDHSGLPGCFGGVNYGNPKIQNEDIICDG
jgi:hypothetical protein